MPFLPRLSSLRPHPGAEAPPTRTAEATSAVPDPRPVAAAPVRRIDSERSRGAAERPPRLPNPAARAAPTGRAVAFRFDPARRARLPAAPPDPVTDALRGQAYLSHVAADPRLMPALRGFVRGHFMIGQSAEEKAETHAFVERIRPIIAQACTDPELVRKLDADVLESQNACEDRTEFFLGQMQVSAVLSALGQGRLGKAELFDVGTAFFKLHEVRSEVGRRTGRHVHFQNVHDYLDAEFQLQDELGLPVRHEVPWVEGFSLLGRTDIRAIGRHVKKALAADDGAAVIRFLANWEPWKKCLLAEPGQAAIQAAANGRFADRITDALTQRTDPRTAWGQLREIDFDARIQAIERERAACNEDHLLVMTRRFLAGALNPP